jgi:hypothetical protein
MLSLSAIKRFIFPLVLIIGLVGIPKPAQAQNNFSSGSTGTAPFSPTASQTVQVPDSGVFNYTTFDIPAGVTITYARNARNTPVTILATGNVTIAGVIVISGLIGNTNGGGGASGPGGFNGGSAGFGFDTFAGLTGDGPGGGGGGGSTNGTNIGGGGGGGFAANGGNGTGTGVGPGGPKYGASTLLPIIGGSGGGGGGAMAGNHAGAGGGGGGAILIASSTSITFTGTITAVGGSGAFTGNGAGGGGGGGAAGAIRLVSNTITGAGILNVAGGSSGSSATQTMNGGNGSAGFVRVEAFNFSSFNPTVPTNTVTFAQPNPVTVPNAPSLRIASIAGVAAPVATVGSFSGVPDIVLPANQTNPVSVVIEATNVPVGTVIQVSLIPSTGSRTTVQTAPLTGTQAASSTTASVNLAAGMSVLTAAAAIDLSTSAHNLLIDGERVTHMEIAAVYGGASQVTYITRSGRRITRTE